MHTADVLECQVVAERVETAAELHALRALGVVLAQGFVLARPGIESLPQVSGAGRAALNDHAS